MKKFITILLSLCMVLSTSLLSFASESDNSVVISQLSVPEALADSSIVDFLNDTGEMTELLEAQKEIRAYFYQTASNYTNSTNILSDVSPSDVQEISEQYALSLPSETETGTIDNGTLYVEKNSRGSIIDIWYIYYPITDKSISVKAAMVDADNPLGVVSGTLMCYTLNNTTWQLRSSTVFSKSNVTNGVISTWNITKWGVKEKFEYSTRVYDNGREHSYNNKNKEDRVRYNFDAQPYNKFTANGGNRHHFIPANSLLRNGFNTNTAYCIRMMVADHKKTGSYGNSSYVATVTSLLQAKKYREALQHEVNDLKSKPDSEGYHGSLQQKYYNEVVTCLVEYEKLFGLR